MASFAPDNPSVLLVDDDATVLQTMGSLLADAGLAVTEAPSLSDAIARLQRSDVDVVVSDVRMERDDAGLELLRVVKGRWLQLPVVALYRVG